MKQWLGSRIFSLIATTILFVVTLLVSSGKAVWPEDQPNNMGVADKVAIGHPEFLLNCSGCHGANALGGDGPNLHHLGLSSVFIATTVRKGIPDQMPAFKKLTPTDLAAVVTYVKSLQ